MKRSTLVAFLCVSVIACKENTEEKQIQINNTNGQTSKISSTIYGNYVDDNYANRTEGSDWVAVSVKKNGDQSVSISVRSRADKKKPTCTYDAIAYIKDENSYETAQDGKKIIFDFSENDISISTENLEDSNLLNFFCNGGASLAGTYRKINETLDTLQLDLTSFSKVLNLQDVGFNISSIMKDDKNTLTIFTFGLEIQDYKESFDIEGEQVIDAEMEDLNSDGSPELFVFTQSIGSGSYGNVYAFSVNNMKSMSQVYFQPTAENNQINQGYMGHDKFAVVENSLAQRFPIYKEEDSNAKPTGGTRQVSYKLVEGEAMRKLEVHKITEY